jgi:hypothetical protein
VRGTTTPHTTHAAKIDGIYDELVTPLLCEIEKVADQVEKRLLNERIKHLPDDNVCKIE